jgi:hypothetical protein
MADLSTLPSDMQIHEFAKSVFLAEFTTSLQAIEKFMGPSESAPIRIVTNGAVANGGYYGDAPGLARTSALVTRRDITSSASVDALKMSSRNDNGVRICAKAGPLSYSPDVDITDIKQADIVAAFARDAADQFRSYLQDAVIYAAIGAISHIGSTLHTRSVWQAAARTNMSREELAALQALMGEDADKIACWVMRSESYFVDLMKDSLGAGVDSVAGMVSYGGSPASLGKPVAVVNHAALTAADGGFDKYYALGLGAGCVEVEIGAPKFYTQQITNTATVRNILRADQDFSIRVPGFQWDKNNGGINPVLDANGIGLSTNWDVTHASAKEVKMVLWEGNYSGN